MTAERIATLETTIEYLAESMASIAKSQEDLASKFTEFLVIEAKREESDKRQHEINKIVTDFIDDYKINEKPIVTRARESQKAFTRYLYIVALPSIFTLLLLNLGAPLYEKVTEHKQANETSKDK